ncbi:hypothetical protein VDGD_03539 [Verticillium dahliae]|nr:FAD binding domain-containing protein [Verticillium dahliae]RBQ71974.1 hypothetical protein VDGD_03539 [Verticillium dahliae]
MAPPDPPTQRCSDDPVLIIGAGISGLLLAQHLLHRSVPFRIFDRDADFTTRGVGWGLTLHWSLPAIRTLLPDKLVQRLPETYVDREAVERGETSRFPLYDLATAKLEAATPPATEAQRIRVTRERLRQLIAEDIPIEWSRAFSSFEEQGERVIVKFDDGSEATGRIVVGCDGSTSRVRRAVFPEQYKGYHLPIRVLGFTAKYTAQEIAPMKTLDPFFLQATSSQDNNFMYFSILDAPGNTPQSNKANSVSMYTGQVVVSWPYQPGFQSRDSPLDFPENEDAKRALIGSFAQSWAEPFRSIAMGVAASAEVKQLELQDYVPGEGLRSAGRVVLMGDAFHAMTMYRGEGANHAVLDVLDFSEKVSPCLEAGEGNLRAVLDAYEDGVVKRVRPAVLAARRACLDAHEWTRITPTSPLLTRREAFMHYEETEPWEA